MSKQRRRLSLATTILVCLAMLGLITAVGTSPTSASSLPAPTVANSEWTSVLRINAGGAEYTDASGQTWMADKYFVGGDSYSVTNPIAATNDQAVFQSERWGMSAYDIPVANGTYQLALDFAEINPNSGTRIFSVSQDSKVLLSNYNISSRVGDYTADVQRFLVTVTTGHLHLNFQASSNSPKLSGLELLTPNATSVFRMNAGGSAFTDSSGLTWQADQYAQVGSGGTYSADNTIANSDGRDAMYQSERWGMNGYDVPIPNGSYVLRLYFAEINPDSGSRVFSVLQDNKVLLGNFDISAKVGDYAADVERFPITVTDGFVHLKFQASTNDPKLSGLELLRVLGQSTTTTTTTRPAGSTTTTTRPSTTTTTTTRPSGSTTTTRPPATTTTTRPPTTTTTTTRPPSTTTTTRPPTTTTTTTVPVLTASGCGRTSTVPSTYQHVIWIWMENKGYNEVMGSSSAPFENKVATTCGYANNYGDNGTHPSEPNYINATSGSDQGISDDNSPDSNSVTADNLFRQVRSNGGTEKSYQESMSGSCELGDDGNYAVKHNPAAFYVGSSDRAACQQNDVNFSQFNTDLNSGHLPNFSFVTPDLCNDTHDCSVSTGDNWLKTVVGQITSSQTYAAGSTAIFVVWDEGEGSNLDRMPFLAIAPSVNPGTVATSAYSHLSLLRATEEMLGIRSFLGGAANATSLRSGFHL